MIRSADVETVPEVGTELQEDEALSTPWQVIVFNDPVNLMSYVEAVLRRIFGYSKEKANRLMLDVHQKGKAIVWTGEREKAEFYVQQLQSYQLLASMKKAG